ncbi:MAG: hypothetical protein K2J81_04860 [Treponemataceae bacterium]|nr:hypothetical protein [Treponemataceae bacterium]
MKLSTARVTGCFRRFVANFFGMLRQILSAFCGSVRQRFFGQKWQDKSAERALPAHFVREHCVKIPFYVGKLP